MREGQRSWAESQVGIPVGNARNFRDVGAGSMFSPSRVSNGRARRRAGFLPARESEGVFADLIAIESGMAPLFVRSNLILAGQFWNT